MRRILRLISTIPAEWIIVIAAWILLLLWGIAGIVTEALLKRARYKRDARFYEQAYNAALDAARINEDLANYYKTRAEDAENSWKIALRFNATAIGRENELHEKIAGLKWENSELRKKLEAANDGTARRTGTDEGVSLGEAAGVSLPGTASASSHTERRATE